MENRSTVQLFYVDQITIVGGLFDLIFDCDLLLYRIELIKHMPIPSKIVNFLDKNKVKYEVINHRTVYTAFDKAATLRVPEKIIGKTLIVKLDNKTALVLVPANKNLDKEKLRKTAKARKFDFAKEAWMKKNLKGVKVGAVPSFGILWKLPTFVDKTLLKMPKIIINGGNYETSIKLSGSALLKIMPDLITGTFTKPKK